MKVDLATFCCSKDVDRLHEAFKENVASHNYPFNNVHLVYQRCVPGPEVHGVYPKLTELSLQIQGLADKFVPHNIFESEYDDILTRNGINPDNKEADDYTHGWKHSHYWRHHCVNHLVAMEKSDADYIVLADADCHMVNKNDWIQKAIQVLGRDPSVLVVSAGDGGVVGKTQTMSQQLFICERDRLKAINFDLPFKGFRNGGPMQEYYFMLEGRIGRYMEKNGLYRYILGAEHRYWHHQW
jgi:cellulose synthase/poly-beta-1,6-N-acetylglucosamine synthase-like glycosyltransferase